MRSGGWTRRSEVAVIRFTEQDIVRHPLVEVILKAYGGDSPVAIRG